MLSRLHIYIYIHTHACSRVEIWSEVGWGQDSSGGSSEKWWTPVNVVLNLCVPQNTGYLLISWETISFSIRIVFNGVHYLRREVLSLFCPHVPLTRMVTDVHANHQPLPKTTCCYEAVRKYLCFNWYSSVSLSWFNDNYRSELSSMKCATSQHASSVEFVILQ
jgi:hypothetical protein